MLVSRANHIADTFYQFKNFFLNDTKVWSISTVNLPVKYVIYKYLQSILNGKTTKFDEVIKYNDTVWDKKNSKRLWYSVESQNATSAIILYEWFRR